MWSTRQLAEVAGVTVRSIRHWHEVGVLPQPPRLSNNYKQYTVFDLVLVLRIKRLSELGFSLEQISTMLVSHSDEKAALLSLREEVTAAIEQLSQTREEIDRLLELGASPDLSPAASQVFKMLYQRQAENAREWSIILAHLLPESGLVWFVQELGVPPLKIVQLDQEFDELAADAADDQRQELASRIVATVQEVTATANVSDQQGKEAEYLEEAVREVAFHTLNPAQRHVMELVFQRLGV